MELLQALVAEYGLFQTAVLVLLFVVIAGTPAMLLNWRIRTRLQVESARLHAEVVAAKQKAEVAEDEQRIKLVEEVRVSNRQFQEQMLERLRKSEGEYKELALQFERLRDDYQVEREARIVAEARAEERDKRVDQLTVWYQQLVDEKIENERTKTALITELNNAKREVETIKAEYRKSNERLDQENSRLRETNTALTTENKELRLIEEQNRKLIERLQEQIGTLESRFEKLEEENACLRQKIEEKYHDAQTDDPIDLSATGDVITATESATGSTSADQPTAN